MDLPPIQSRVLTSPAATKQAIDSVDLTELDRRLVGVTLIATVQKEAVLTTAARQALVRTFPSESPPDGLNNSNLQMNQGRASPLKFFNATLQLLPGQNLPATVNIPPQIVLASTVSLPLKESLPIQLSAEGSFKPAQVLLTEKPEAQPTLQQALRQYLPHGNTAIAAASVKTLHSLWQELAAVPEKQRSQVISNAQWKSLSAIIDTTTIPQSRINKAPLFTGATITKILENSGNFLESRIQKQSTNSANNRGGFTIPDSDLKRQLLTLFQQSAVSPDQPISTSSTSQTLQQALTIAAGQMRLFDQLMGLFQQFKSGANADDKQNLKSQIKQLLSAASALGLAKISVNQLQQLLESVDQHRTGISHTIDLPLRINDQCYPLHLQIQEHIKPASEQDEKNASGEQKQSTKRSRWQIFMELELAKNGWFATEITIENEHLSTRFWSQNPNIAERTRTRLEMLKSTLEHYGLCVDELRMEQGSPPPKKQPIMQTLVDVKT